MIDPAPQIEIGLVRRIREGDQSSWNDLIASFEQRLLAFAVHQVDRHDIAEDLVQETFISFLKVVDQFRHDCELETFLFQILRRRIIDFYRSEGRTVDARVCIHDEVALTHEPCSHVDAEVDPATQLEDAEQASYDESRLANAIRIVTQQWCQNGKFRELQVAEACLYANLSNQQASRLLACEPREVAMLKHRIIKKLSTEVSAQQLARQRDIPENALLSGMLRNAWESRRPSCPKRTTLGKYVFGLLTNEWKQHVHFHVELLGCRFCQASLAELSGAYQVVNPDYSERLFQSTAGFLATQKSSVNDR